MFLGSLCEAWFWFGALSSSKMRQRAGLACGLRAPCVSLEFKACRKAVMNLETLSIEVLAALRDKAIQTLSDKVAARQKEPLAELERVGALVASKPSTVRPKASSEVS
jgi:hypothetical protein